MPTDVTPLSRWQKARIWARRVAEAMVIVVALGLLLLWCSVPDVGKLAAENPTTTAFIDLRRDQAQAAHKPFKLEFTWKPRALISKYLRVAVVYAEDAKFYDHEGVDWDAIEQAAARDWSSGEMAAGGSTITQQLAKNLYLSPSRSLIRKARELWIAYALEDHLGKDRILELYLNVVEWGDGVFGAEAAAQHWYHKSAAALTPAQAARLAVALPNPFKRSPAEKSDELDRKAARILRLMRRDRIIDVDQRQAGMAELGLNVPLPKPPPPPQATVQTDASPPPAVDAEPAGPVRTPSEVDPPVDTEETEPTEQPPPAPAPPQ